MRLDQEPAVIEADDLLIGARGEGVAHVSIGNRIERLRDRR